MNNTTELDLLEEQSVEAVTEADMVKLSSIELDLVGGGGPISVFL